MQKTFLLLTIMVLYSSVAAAALPYFGQTPTSYHSQTDYGNNAQAGHYAVSDGSKIYYEVYGHGKPIVVLHGGLVGSPAEMGQFIDQLATNRQVIVVNTRGHGKSEVGNVPPTYPQKAKDITQVLKNAGISDKVDLLGFSDGAYTALRFAAAYPTLTDKVVAIGAGEWKKGFVQPTRNPNMSFADLEKLDPVYWQQQRIRPQPMQTAQWFATANRVYNQTQISHNVLGKIQSPVLLIVGEDDKNTPLDTVLAAYRQLPHADLAVIANTPHPAFMVNFAAVWAAVAPFLHNSG